MPIPAFPGAHHIRVMCLDCANFHTNACSRPPEPITKTFIGAIQTGKRGGASA
jgi:hypothetical protein